MKRPDAKIDEGDFASDEWVLFAAIGAVPQRL